MCHSGPLSCFANLSLSSRTITVSHQSFTVLTDINNFYPQFLPTILSQISTGLHRSSQFYLAIQPLLIHFLLGILSPRSSQIFHRSFKDLSQIFLPPSPFTWYLDSRSFRPTLQFSKSLLLLPYPHSSSQIFNRSSKKFFLPSSPISWYLDSRSFRPTLQISKSFLFLPYPYGSSQIFHSFFKNLSSSIPYYLVSGQSVIPAHSPVLQNPPFPFLSLHFVTDLSQIFQKVFLPPSLTSWSLDSRSFRPTLQLPSPLFSSFSSFIFIHLPLILLTSFFLQSLIP